jgi:hypothetical protein
MKIDSLENAIEVFKSASIEHGKASEEGDYKVGNKNYYKIVDAAKYLNENDSVNELLQLLNHDNVSVQLWAATYLLEKHENEAIKLLTSISKKNITHYSFNAQMTLDEWKSGDLKLQY